MVNLIQPHGSKLAPIHTFWTHCEIHSSLLLAPRALSLSVAHLLAWIEWQIFYTTHKNLSLLRFFPNKFPNSHRKNGKYSILPTKTSRYYAFFLTNFLIRIERMANILHYPQKPLATRSSRAFPFCRPLARMDRMANILYYPQKPLATTLFS
jgi:hypothetical protein